MHSKVDTVVKELKTCFGRQAQMKELHIISGKQGLFHCSSIATSSSLRLLQYCRLYRMGEGQSGTFSTYLRKKKFQITLLFQ